MPSPRLCAAMLLASLPAAMGGERSMPSAELFFDNGESFYAQPGGNTVKLPLKQANAPASTLVMLPKGNENGCKKITTKPKFDHFTFVVSRGGCSFELKASHAEEAGASGVLIYNTLEAMYDDDDSTPGVVSCHDLDCSLTRKWVHKDQLTAEVAYNFPSYDCNTDTDCDSGLCGLTGKVTSKGHESCCMLDGYLNMSVNRTYTLMTVYVNIENGRKLLEMVEAKTVTMQVATRSVPSFDPASFMIWGVGVLTCLIACSLSAEAERRKQQGMKFEDEPFALAFGPSQSDNVSIDSGIAVGFMMFASFALLALFFAFKYAPSFTLQLVVAGYCCGAVGSVTNVLLFPFFRALFPFFEQCIVNVPFGGGRMSIAALIATFFSCCLSLWFFLSRQASYSWILQDIISFSYCVMILQVAQLPNIRVSAVLLSCAFCYDVFFVFLSPLVFDSSVMIQVATGGQAGLPVKDTNTGDNYCDDFCNFHGESARCPDHEALPMLFRIPRMQDWRGGAAMLGLGDIVLPGLLLSFLLRYDIAHKKKNAKASCGYFSIAAVGYAVGLMMANCAVYLMHMGQPALLYLVPCTLGSTLAVGYSRDEFNSLWVGFEEDDVTPSIHDRRPMSMPGVARGEQEHAPLKSQHDDY